MECNICYKKCSSIFLDSLFIVIDQIYKDEYLLKELQILLKRQSYYEEFKVKNFYEKMPKRMLQRIYTMKIMLLCLWIGQQRERQCNAII